MMMMLARCLTNRFHERAPEFLLELSIDDLYYDDSQKPPDNFSERIIMASLRRSMQFLIDTDSIFTEMRLGESGSSKRRLV